MENNKYQVIDSLKNLADYEEAEQIFYRVQAMGALLRGELAFERFIRRTLSGLWRNVFGWRRFLIVDWWKLKLNIK